jgi:mono/diheme cytochrome c family protein
LRRFSLTIFLLVALFVVGGLAIARLLGEPSLARAAYSPTLSEDPATAQWQALLLVLGIGFILFNIIGIALTLAIVMPRFTRMLRAAEASSAVEAPARSAGPRTTAKQEHDIPLSSERSAAIFWIVVVLIVVGFQVLRLWGQPLGYLPGLGEMLNMPLFRLPGEQIEGLPPFIAGPGDFVTAFHIFVAVLGAAIVTTLIAGFLLARGVGMLSHTMETAGQRPPTLPDRLIPAIEARIARLRTPRPATRRIASNPVNNILMGINVLLLLTIAGIVAFYVVPSYSGVAAVDNALEATRMAALATATPQGGAVVPEGTGMTRIEALQAEFDALPAGNVSAGQQTFSASGCVACHSLSAGVTLVGPSLADMGQTAPTRRPDYSGELYIYESIINPDAYVVPGFQGGVMPQTFKQILQPQQLADLVAFLESQ